MCFSGTPQTALLKLVWTLAGADTAVNVFGVLNPGNIAVTQALTNSVDTAIKSAYTSSGLASMHAPTWSLARISLRSVSSANQMEFIGTAAPVVGTAATPELLPLQTAYCVTLRTANSGPQFRGRSYLPGFLEGQNTANGTAGAVVQTNSVAFITAIKSALTANALDLGVFSRPQFGPDCVVVRAGHTSVVTAIIGRDLLWDTQRRRAIPGI